MNRSIRTAILALTAMSVITCGESFPPEPCDIIRQQTVHIGETKTVAVCFNDADGDDFTLSARSSDDGVATVRTQLSAVVVEGVDVGIGIIMVTATDPDGQTGEMSFTVDVPNRAPAGSVIAPVTLTNDAPSAELTLTEYFADPDGHALTFTAQSSDPVIASATVTGSILAIQSESNGSASVRVTATDPHDLSATESIDITVLLSETLLRDDFDGPSIDDVWDVSKEGFADIENGRLRTLVSDEEGRVEGVVTRLAPVEDWVVSANVEAASEKTWPTIFLLGGGTNARLSYGVMIGGNLQMVNPNRPRTNLIIVVSGPEGYQTQAGWHGLYDEIKGPGEAMDVAVGMDGTSMTVTVDGTLVHSVAVTVPPRMVEAVALVGWYGGEFEPRRVAAYFDWTQFDGLPVGRYNSQTVTTRFLDLPKTMKVKK